MARRTTSVCNRSACQSPTQIAGTYQQGGGCAVGSSFFEARPEIGTRKDSFNHRRTHKKGSGLTLAEGICPLGLPVLVDWSEFPEARALKNHLLLLPVHQGLTTSHKQYVAEVFVSLLDGHKGSGPNGRPGR